MRDANSRTGPIRLGNKRVAPILMIDARGANLKTTRNAVIFFVIATLLFVTQVSAQETGAKRGAVKGIVSLKGGTLERAKLEGIALELKPLTNGSSPTAVITDAGGNFEFTCLADGEYALHLLGDGFEPFTATVRIEDGATVAQNVLVKVASLTQRVEIKELARVGAPSVVDGVANDIVSKVLTENERRSERLRGYKVTRRYQIMTLEGKVVAQTVAQMEYRAPGEKRFEKTSEKGSGNVRHLVFDRLMESENDSASGNRRQESALTPANYDFRFTGEEDIGLYHCYVLEAIPKRKDKYLFEGRIWVESHDFAVARIEGHPAKELSFWVNQANFVREYQNLEGFWLPLRDKTQVSVRFYGRRVLTIDHGQYAIEGQTEPKANIE